MSHWTLTVSKVFAYDSRMQERKNWVSRRIAVEKSLLNNSRCVWNEVRSALQDACSSYSDYYCAGRGKELTSALENGSRIRIDLPNPVTIVGPSMALESKAMSIVVAFNHKLPAVEWADDNGSHSVMIAADEKEAFLFDGEKRLSPDELSRIILEHLLFPER